MASAAQMLTDYALLFSLHLCRGHSVFAPTGRWQNNKDVNWYNKDKDGDDQVAAAEKRRKELMEVKMREEEEMNKRL